MNYKATAIIVAFIFIFISIIPNTIGKEKETHNLSMSTADKIDDLLFDFKMIKYKTKAHFPSVSCCVIKEDEVVWSKSYGYSRLYMLQKASEKTLYRLGSVSKSFTATAVLNLYDKGLLDIDDDINDYLPFHIRNPNYPDKNITIKMLLSHQSSIYDYCLHDKEGFKSEFKHIIPFPDDAGGWLESVLIPGGELYNSKYWMDWEPGTSTRYSNIAYTMLGYIVKEVTGSFEEYITENVFKPLKMDNTGYFISDINFWHMAKPYWFYGYTYGIQLPVPNYRINCFNSMGGVISSIEDMSNYLTMHINNGVFEGTRILNESTIEMMHTIQLDVKDERLFDLKYGLGWMFGEHFGEPLEGHLGGVPGFNCAMIMNKTSKTGFIFLANQNNLDYSDRFMDAFTSIGKLLLEKVKEY